MTIDGSFQEKRQLTIESFKSGKSSVLLGDSITTHHTIQFCCGTMKFLKLFWRLRAL